MSQSGLILQDGLVFIWKLPVNSFFGQGETDRLRVWCPVTILWAFYLDGIEAAKDGSSLTLDQLDGIHSTIHELMISLGLELISCPSKDQFQSEAAVTQSLIDQINVLPGVDQN